MSMIKGDAAWQLRDTAGWLCFRFRMVEVPTRSFLLRAKIRSPPLVMAMWRSDNVGSRDGNIRAEPVSTAFVGG